MRQTLIPVAVLIVVVAIVCGLVLSGAMQGKNARSRGEEPTTVPTIEVGPQR